jgi:Zn-finger nucleic acid-binding protein
MPLLTSPIDGSPMRQIHRYGIELDVCPTSGGIWLDKGELEKLMHLLREEVMDEQARQVPPPSNRYYREDDDYHRYSKKGYYGSGRYKKKSKVSKIMDLFDF